MTYDLVVDTLHYLGNQSLQCLLLTDRHFQRDARRADRFLRVIVSSLHILLEDSVDVIARKALGPRTVSYYPFINYNKTKK